MSRSKSKPSLNVRIALFFTAEALLLGGLWWAGNHQMDAMNHSVNDIAELKDPSPYRAALMGHLGKIRLGLQGFLGSGDTALAEQVAQSRKDFDAALPEFQKENPRLFPKSAVDEIRRAVDAYKEAIDHTLGANVKRTKSRNTLDQNFARIVSLIDHTIKPLIREDQPQAEERREAVLNIENQARAWQQNLAKAWSQPSQSAMELTYENDNRGASYIDRYFGLELLSREKKMLKETRGIWQATSDLGHESFAMEKVVTDPQAFMDAQRELVVAALTRFLPAMLPTELAERKKGYVNAIRLHSAVT